MAGCAVQNCTNSSKKNNQMIKFPTKSDKNKIRRKKWELFCKRGNLFKAKNEMKICKVTFLVQKF